MNQTVRSKASKQNVSSGVATAQTWIVLKLLTVMSGNSNDWRAIPLRRLIGSTFRLRNLRLGTRFQLIAMSVSLLALTLWTCGPQFFRDQGPSERGTTDDERIRQMMHRHPQFPFDRTQKLAAPHLKTILLWNSWFWFDSSFFFGTGHQPFVDAQCPVSDCFVSNNLYAMPPSEYDAILFFYPMLTAVPFTYSRRADQLYVFVDEEPPLYTSRVSLSDFNGFFNLTMTYRTDSDIFWPYGTVQPPVGFNSVEARLSESDGINYARGKTKLVAWFVSNCNSWSYREKYVRLLEKYIEVDIYGKCANESKAKVCWLQEQETCYDMLERDYKFYLSFENSFCRDYVTEKFFEILDRRIVPIVYGAVRYSSIAPPGSYIDATQMGARNLAKLLLKIDRDDHLYNQYFWWKTKGYQIKKKRVQFARPAFCDLCKYLHQSHPQQIYLDMEAWWSPKYHCHQNQFTIPFKRFSFDGVDLDSIKPWTNLSTVAQSVYHANRDYL